MSHGVSRKKKFLLLIFNKCLKSNATAATVSNPYRKYAHEHTLLCAHERPMLDLLSHWLVLSWLQGWGSFLEDQMGELREQVW